MDIYCKFRLGHDYGGSKPPPYGWNIDPKKNKMPGSNSGPGLQKKPDKVSAYDRLDRNPPPGCTLPHSLSLRYRDLRPSPYVRAGGGKYHKIARRATELGLIKTVD